MAVPSNRVPVRVARGNRAAIDAHIDSLLDGELVYSKDEQALYVVEESQEGTALVNTSLFNTLGSLQDVDLSKVLIDDGFVIQWSETDEVWEARPNIPTLAGSELNELRNVDSLDIPNQGDVLTFVEGRPVVAGLLLNFETIPGEEDDETVPVFIQESEGNDLYSDPNQDPKQFGNSPTTTTRLGTAKFLSKYGSFRSNPNDCYENGCSATQGLGTYMVVEPGRSGVPMVLGTEIWTLDYWWRSGSNTEPESEFYLDGGPYKRIIGPRENVIGGCGVVQLTTPGTQDSDSILTKVGAHAFRVIVGSSGATSYIVGTTDAVLDDGLWHHIAFMHEGEGVYSCFVDGELKQRKIEVDGAIDLNYATGSILGARYDLEPATFLNGDIDAFRWISELALWGGKNGFIRPVARPKAGYDTGGWVADRPQSAGVDAIELKDEVLITGINKSDVLVEILGDRDFTTDSFGAELVYRRGAARTENWTSKAEGAFRFNAQGWIEPNALQIPDLGTLNFTMQFWMRPSNVLLGRFQTLMDTSGVTASQAAIDSTLMVIFGCQIYLDYNGALSVKITGRKGNVDQFYEVMKADPGLLTNGQDHHVAFTKELNTYRLWLDGVQVAELSTPQPHYWSFQLRTDSANPPRYARPRLGAACTYNPEGTEYTGYLADIQILKGAKYTAAFTPPTRTTGALLFPERELGTIGIDSDQKVYIVSEKSFLGASTWKELGGGGGGGGGGAGASSLNDLSDVNSLGAGNGMALVWNGSKWSPSTVSAGASALGDLTDVDSLNPQTGDVLTYINGFGWGNSPIAIRTDAASNGLQYARKDGGWDVIVHPIAIDAANDGKKYVRQSGGWTEITQPIAADAANDGKAYVRKSGAWSEVAISIDAPSDPGKYVRSQGGWTLAPVQSDAPSNGQQFTRQDGNWEPVAHPVDSDAPSNGKQFARKDGAWVEVQVPSTGGLIPEAPLDGTFWVRKGGQWIDLATALDELGFNGGGGGGTGETPELLSGGDFSTGSGGSSDVTVSGGDFTTGSGGSADETIDGGDFTNGSSGGTSQLPETASGGDFSSGSGGGSDVTVSGGDFTTGSGGSVDETMDGGDFSSGSGTGSQLPQTASGGDFTTGSGGGSDVFVSGGDFTSGSGGSVDETMDGGDFSS